MQNKTRKQRVRTKIRARGQRPRLSVFVSNRHVYAQIIDDSQGKTLVAAKDTEVETEMGNAKDGGKNITVSQKVGEILAQKAIKAGIKEVVFDRGERKYHGRVRALADSAREGGLKF